MLNVNQIFSNLLKAQALRPLNPMFLVLLTLLFVSKLHGADLPSTQNEKSETIKASLPAVSQETPEEQNTDLPSVELVSEQPEPIEKPVDPAIAHCQSIITQEDIENRYEKIRKGLEVGFREGLPHQLRKDLVRVREDLDHLSTKIFDVDSNNPQEVNHTVQLMINHLEKMIGLVPKAHKIAPIVRDRYVVPFTNINSIKAEHQDCLMKAAIEEIQQKQPASNEAPESSGNIYRKLTGELERLNKNLYTLQTTDVQKFISMRADLLNKLEKFNRNPEKGFAITSPIPNMINSVHTEIERLLPGLELSKKYYSILE